MKKFWIVLSVCWLWTCSDGGDKATGPEEPPIVVNLTSLGGQAQKGPFNNGTAINIAELTNTLSPTGRNFSSSITDNTGRFAVANVQLESPYVELRANGYYFNEVSNEISSGQLTLFALSNLTGKTSLNVNILTHLEKNRMVALMSGDNPKTFAQAKIQAQEEVLAIFDYSRANVPESELLDISQGGAANAKLLAMSAIIQGDLTVGQMSQLLANMSTDIASDGTLDDTNLRNTLIENSKNLDMAAVRSNIVAHYTSLGISATIPDFETEINQFLKPPVAQDMSASTAEDTAINITLAGSDPEGESLTYTILEVNNATVTLNGNVANYLPDANYNGTDTFTYYANDGTTDSNVATVTMTVSGEDDDPNTQNAAATTDEDVAVVLQLSAEEYDGDSYSFAIIDQPSNGTVSLDGVNATYTPNQDFNGTDTFTFEATDDTGRFMNVGTATITVNPVNDLPILDDATISASVDEEASVDITITATDVDGDQLSYQFSTSDNNGNQVNPQGNISINGNVFTFTSNPDSELSEGVTTDGQFYYYVVDNSNTINGYGLATVTITGVDDSPHADNLDVSVNENSNVFITLSSTDPDGGDNSNIQYEISQNPDNGTITLNNDIVEYIPNSDFYGSDSFKYKVVGDTNEGVVNITIYEVVGITKTFEIDANWNNVVTDVIVGSNNKFIVYGRMTHKFSGAFSPKTFMAEFNQDLSLNRSVEHSLDNTSTGDLIELSNNSFVVWNQAEITFIDSDFNIINTVQPHTSIGNGDGTYFQIGSVYEDSGSLIISGKDISTNDGTMKPMVARMDFSGNILYNNIFETNNLDTSEFSYDFNGYGRSIIADNTILIAGTSRRVNWTCNNQTSIFEIEDNGSSFNLLNQFNEPNPDCSVSDDAGGLTAVSIALKESTGSGIYFNVAGTSNNDFIFQTFAIEGSGMTKMEENHSIYIQDFRDENVELIVNPSNPAEAYLIAASTTSYIYLYKYNGGTIEWGGTRTILNGKTTDDWLGGIDYIGEGIHNGKIIFGGWITNHTDNTNPGFLMILDSNGE